MTLSLPTRYIFSLTLGRLSHPHPPAATPLPRDPPRFPSLQPAITETSKSIPARSRRDRGSLPSSVLLPEQRTPTPPSPRSRASTHGGVHPQARALARLHRAQPPPCPIHPWIHPASSFPSLARIRVRRILAMPSPENTVARLVPLAVVLHPAAPEPPCHAPPPAPPCRRHGLQLASALFPDGPIRSVPLRPRLLPWRPPRRALLRHTAARRPLCSSMAPLASSRSGGSGALLPAWHCASQAPNLAGIPRRSCPSPEPDAAPPPSPFASPPFRLARRSSAPGAARSSASSRGRAARPLAPLTAPVPRLHAPGPPLLRPSRSPAPR